MRFLPVLLVLALLMLVPLAGAATWDDPAGDHEVGYIVARGDQGETVWLPEAPEGWYPDVDLVDAGIGNETEDTLTFFFEVAGEEPDATEPDGPGALQYSMEFTFHDELRRIVVVRYPQWDWLFAGLQHQEMEEWVWDRGLPVEPLEDAPGWRVVVDKWGLRDSRMIPAMTGDRLRDIRITSGPADNSFGGGLSSAACPRLDDGQAPRFDGPCGITVRDAVGDGDALGDYEIQVDPRGLGHLLWETDNPIRASNGLATTYVYDVRLVNLADRSDRVVLQLGDVASDWQVFAPPSVELGPEEIRDIQVGVSVPFKHVHGESDFFTVRAVSQGEASASAEVHLGVVWADVPQPAGHHRTLHFHGMDWDLWMNTLQEEPAAENPETGESQTELRPNRVSGCFLCVDTQQPTASQEATYEWTFPLRPQLLMGLDFDLSGTVAGELPVRFPFAFEGNGSFDLALLDAQSGAQTTLARQEWDSLSWATDETVRLALDAAPEPEADRLPFEPGRHLFARLTLQGEEDPVTWAAGLPALATDPRGARGAAPVLLRDDAAMRLPLFDYHAEVDRDLLDSYNRLWLRNASAAVKDANPGRTAVLVFEAGNVGERADTVRWSLEGESADWAEVIPARTRLAAGGNATVVVRVDVPESAREGDAADLLLVGASERDPESQAFQHLLVRVVTNEDIPDELDLLGEAVDRAKADSAKESPGVAPAMLVLAGLAAVAWRRRR